MDEDNAASMYRDPTGWTIHRKRAWTTVLNGGHYDYIDFSITVGSETGTAMSRSHIRSWMQYLSEFISSFDYIHADNSNGWLGDLPDHVTASTLSARGDDYVAYLADDREITDPAAGQPLHGTVKLALPNGTFAVRLFSPVSGQSSPAVRMEGGGTRSLILEPFRDDIVIRASKISP